ncbi:hypothetical protein TNCT_411561 [Trichonephila clavata]|uniref:Uncharacterized protein n=1 Tax=Trichonephila clavata TaxID=2740835 RepID=A0A8X6KVZ2_TRICU|nr:hypothetical protein TNCT_411561 [Trichonephila clavata]
MVPPLNNYRNPGDAQITPPGKPLIGFKFLAGACEGSLTHFREYGVAMIHLLQGTCKIGGRSQTVHHFRVYLSRRRERMIDPKRLFPRSSNKKIVFEYSVLGKRILKFCKREEKL